MPVKKEKAVVRLHRTVGILAAAAAVGLLLIQFFDNTDTTPRPGILLAAQISLGAIAAVCAALHSIRKGLPVWHNIFNAGAVVAVVGMLLLVVMVSGSRTRGSDPVHILQITMLSIAAVCAVGIAVFEVRAALRRRAQNRADKTPMAD